MPFSSLPGIGKLRGMVDPPANTTRIVGADYFIGGNIFSYFGIAIPACRQHYNRFCNVFGVGFVQLTTLPQLFRLVIFKHQDVLKPQ